MTAEEDTMDACPTCGVNADGYTDLLRANTEKIGELRAEVERLERSRHVLKRERDEANEEARRYHEEIETLRNATCGQHGIRCRIIDVGYHEPARILWEDDAG